MEFPWHQVQVVVLVLCGAVIGWGVVATLLDWRDEDSDDGE